jgi:hypothetical protein
MAVVPRETGVAIRRPLPPTARRTSILGVAYDHLTTPDGGELYLTRYGASVWEHLLPENWYAREWFEAKRKRLMGTSTVYHVPTRCLHNTVVPLVVKWSRVGEEVPMETITISKFIDAEFNSPFEEFALVMELKRGAYGPPGMRIRSQKPLAIYVPSERLQLWQTGRSESKIAAKIARHPSVELDILRQYVVIYGWIKGLDLVEVAELWKMTGSEREHFLAQNTSMVIHELEGKGYRVIDMKAAHVIVRPRRPGELLRDAHGQIVYALVDYELLERTSAHEDMVRQTHRRHYLHHVAHRFQVPSGNPIPPHLSAMRLLDVDYVFGQTESTGGRLWVVGKDPDLFNYFLPERWRRTPKTSLSTHSDVFYTCTKDNINLVWRISRMGEIPSNPAVPGHLREMIACGYNSPFEEFAFAHKLSQLGIKTVYPRAIYMTGHAFPRTQKVEDSRRYRGHASLQLADGSPVLSKRHDYITIWGFWNGPDEFLALHDGEYYLSRDLKAALNCGIVREPTASMLLDMTARQLRECGFEHLDLRAEHLLLSLSPCGDLVRDRFGQPEVRLCNFELLRPVACRV